MSTSEFTPIPPFIANLCVKEMQTYYVLKDLTDKFGVVNNEVLCNKSEKFVASCIADFSSKL